MQQSAFELTLQKGGQTLSGGRTSLLGNSAAVKHEESTNSDKLSIMDDDLMVESDENTLSRANSNNSE